jgi:hypothetical protein
LPDERLSILGYSDSTASSEYAFRARLKDITDMSLTLELPSTAGFRKTVHVDNTSFSDLQMFQVGHIQIFHIVVILL